MSRKVGLAAIAAMSLALAGCENKGGEVPANPAPPVEANSGAGRSSPTGGTCGGIMGQMCSAAGDFCKFPEGQCRMPDAQGTCAAKPQVCTREYAPVCGCDGKTYGNACEADAAGVSVQTRGQCPKLGA